MTVKVITDSTSGITKELAAEKDMGLVSLTINTKDGEYIDTETDLDWFYENYLTTTEAIPTSSQPSIEVQRKLFEDAAKDGRDALAVTISEEMSGTIQSMRIAAEEVKRNYPDWNYAIVDSRSNSYQAAFVALRVNEAAANGATLEECVKVAEDVKSRLRFLFVPESLEYLKHGGRMGRVSAIIGSALQMRPVLGVLNGETHVFKTVRTQKKAIKTMVQMYLDAVERSDGLDDMVIHYIGNKSDGEAFQKEYIEPLVGRTFPVVPVSPVIGVHVGPAVGFVFMTNKPIVD